MSTHFHRTTDKTRTRTSEGNRRIPKSACLSVISSTVWQPSNRSSADPFLRFLALPSLSSSLPASPSSLASSTTSSSSHPASAAPRRATPGPPSSLPAPSTDSSPPGLCPPRRRRPHPDGPCPRPHPQRTPLLHFLRDLRRDHLLHHEHTLHPQQDLWISFVRS